MKFQKIITLSRRVFEWDERFFVWLGFNSSWLQTFYIYDYSGASCLVYILIGVVFCFNIPLDVITFLNVVVYNISPKFVYTFMFVSGCMLISSLGH